MLGETGAPLFAQSAGFETKKTTGEGGFEIRSNKLFVSSSLALNFFDVIRQAFAFSLDAVLEKTNMRFFACKDMLEFGDQRVDY